MNTRAAFIEMINTWGIYHAIGLTKGRVGSIKDNIKKGKWPTIDKMEELLLKAGYQVAQEKEWKIISPERSNNKNSD